MKITGLKKSIIADNVQYGGFLQITLEYSIHAILRGQKLPDVYVQHLSHERKNIAIKTRFTGKMSYLQNTK